MKTLTKISEWAVNRQPIRIDVWFRDRQICPLRIERIAKSVPKPRLRQNVFRVRRIFLYLLAEQSDVGSQVFEFLPVFEAPHGTKQFNVMKRHVRVLHQEL